MSSPRETGEQDLIRSTFNQISGFAASALKTELEHMVEGCQLGKVRECRVIAVLADHGQCEHSNH